ncbi:GAF and ANTAR domain-containing protein [Amycolatopsis pithecellobii]|uniref:ANTAR domain-containing protein n=1 Tax=Amycolatopsis pithecellobii TaxID=664692 RepID=A0A6N7YND3_9PSEU|nr:GAF and ANTAR domain-containing protein [Amycolatopsis pithecellobii]MTD53378.1 ANTAR domain-containing protein [Amycolatopsis pithecellobii]
MANELTVQQALVLRFSGALDDLDGTLAQAAGVLAPLVVLDLRGVGPLSTTDARAVHAFVRARADEGVRCHVVADPAGAAARALAGLGVAPVFGALEQALTSDDDPRENALPDQLEALTRTLLGKTTVAAALEKIVEAAGVVMPAADLVSVTLRSPEGEFTTPIETDPVALELDQVQYNSGKGPCLDAAKPDGPGYVRSDDLAHEQRWPEFASGAVGHGYASILSTELLQAIGSARPSGALNIYSRRLHGFSETDRHLALLLATHASLALAHTHTTELAELQATQLREAISTRDVIGQAKGILMNRQGISPDEAFHLLRTTSQALNVKLVDVARTLTDRHGELDLPG